jgi:hypothetical protein
MAVFVDAQRFYFFSLWTGPLEQNASSQLCLTSLQISNIARNILVPHGMAVSLRDDGTVLTFVDACMILMMLRIERPLIYSLEAACLVNVESEGALSHRRTSSHF